MVKVFVYGTLKKDFYNHSRWGMEEAEFLGTKILTGAKLFSLGPYPCATISDNKNDTIQGEVYDIPDTTFQQISQMEIGAGYSLRTINIDGEDINIFVFNNEPEAEQIMDGVWK